MRKRLLELLMTDIECNKDGLGECSRCEYEYAEVECAKYLTGIITDFLLEHGVIALPVTIGQPVWELCRWQHKETEIREGKVSMLQQKADKSWKIRISVNSSVYDITLDEIGKKVFLTKEAAEQALNGE